MNKYLRRTAPELIVLMKMIGHTLSNNVILAQEKLNCKVFSKNVELAIWMDIYDNYLWCDCLLHMICFVCTYLHSVVHVGVSIAMMIPKTAQYAGTVSANRKWPFYEQLFEVDHSKSLNSSVKERENTCP